MSRKQENGSTDKLQFDTLLVVLFSLSIFLDTHKFRFDLVFFPVSLYLSVAFLPVIINRTVVFFRSYKTLHSQLPSDRLGRHNSAAL